MTDEFTKSILGTAVGLQATGLMASNLKLLPKFSNKGKKKKLKMKTPKTGEFIKTGVGNIIGIGLLSAQAGMINKL